ncbi:MAG: 2-oxoisovalerate dehydrogenase [Candidatus Rokubacteria bacterium]|nr:2-oxoisovalerate dehydrogenase [Candidatus Rokubacteria bacterium]
MERSGEGSPPPEVIFLVEEAPEGGFTARALGESILTEADDIADLHASVRDAVRCHFDDDKIPKIIRLHFVREEVITA